MPLVIKEVTASVYAKNEEKGIYYVKASVVSIGMYITSITVRSSPKYDDLWVQMPAFYAGRWTKPIEFSGGSQFHELIKDAALRAVDEYNNSPVVTDIDENFDMSKELDNVIKP